MKVNIDKNNRIGKMNNRQNKNKTKNLTQNDEVSVLRAEISELKNTVNQMSILVSRLLSSLEQNNNQQLSQSLPIITSNQFFQ